MWKRFESLKNHHFFKLSSQGFPPPQFGHFFLNNHAKGRRLTTTFFITGDKLAIILAPIMYYDYGTALSLLMFQDFINFIQNYGEFSLSCKKCIKSNFKVIFYL